MLLSVPTTVRPPSSSSLSPTTAQPLLLPTSSSIRKFLPFTVRFFRTLSVEHFLSNTFFRTLSYLALRPPTTVVRGNSAFHVEHKHNAAADSAAQTEKVLFDRRVLQRGLAASKQTHNRFVKSWKKRFLWVSEDLLFLRWCHGKKKDWQDSEDNVTFIEVANIGDIKAAGDHKFNVILIDDPGKELHFDLGKTVSCSKWVQCLTDLCKDQLAYTLLRDDRDKGTDISIHWRGGDHSAQYQHLR
jgi:hypothetical protein